jgi:hypothetical protein
MLSMVTISYMGAATLKSHAFDGPVKAIEKYDKLVVGAILCGVGVITYVRARITYPLPPPLARSRRRVRPALSAAVEGAGLTRVESGARRATQLAHNHDHDHGAHGHHHHHAHQAHPIEDYIAT